MATNEGVGKKIVEALKKQAEPDVDFNQDLVEVVNDELDTASYDNEEKMSEEEAVNNLFGEPVNREPEVMNTLDEDRFEIKEQPLQEEPVISQEQQINVQKETPLFERPIQPQGWNFDEGQEFQTRFVETPAPRVEVSTKQFDMPPNVSVLKKLITQLPAGVTKQTGAQIIKQTMEALGISMNTVLHEAQKVQDDMNESIKSCMLSIQEYKNNIKNLEKQGLDYQRQVNQLNDLISLFILSDKD